MTALPAGGEARYLQAATSSGEVQRDFSQSGCKSTGKRPQAAFERNLLPSGDLAQRSGRHGVRQRADSCYALCEESELLEMQAGPSHSGPSAQTTAVLSSLQNQKKQEMERQKDK